MAMALAAMLLAGCGSGGGEGGASGQETQAPDAGAVFAPDQNSIYLGQDLGIRSALVVGYDATQGAGGAYTSEGLAAFVGQAVGDFNAAQELAPHIVDASGQSKQPVSLVSCEVGGGKAVVVYDYASAIDFLNFTQETGDANALDALEVRRVSGGIPGNIEFISADDGKAVRLSDVQKLPDAVYVYLRGGANVQTEGKILYTAGAMTATGEHTAVCAGGAGYLVFR
jgi:hypothetical protein